LIFNVGAKSSKYLEKRLSKSGIYELFGANWWENKRIVGTLVPKFTPAALNLFISADLNNVESTKRFIQHFPHGASVRESVHYGQIVNSQQF